MSERVARQRDQKTAAVTSKSDGPGNDDQIKADELDKEQLAQLHNATLKASDYCFELKKLCATILVPTGALVSVFSDKKLDPAVFVSGLLVVAAFWLADAVGFYYQRKLRIAMDHIWRRRAARCSEPYVYVPTTQPVGAVRAAFNTSMIYYLILGLILTACLILLWAGAFSTSSGQQP
ncbi:hypothetical protein [Catelliglobosispora koreensis]|uniref:hypothetical protein n=1 Tax=Catelliglobosispora koreensis TaxID=129052 RepID=UPI000688D358|nr:hypothetical protein [Catelliglobosispora koreensis]